MLQTQLQDETLSDKIKALRVWLKPQPYTGKIWLDCLNLLLVAAVQLAILPTLLPGPMTIDLMTPWLILGFVRGSLSRTICTAVFAGLLIETYSAIPSGFYVSCYFVIGVLLYLVRASLSWRLKLPWVVSLAASQLVIILFEAFVIYLAGMANILTPLYGLVQAARLTLATAFGVILVDTRWIPEEEEVA